MERRKKKKLPDAVAFDPQKNLYDSFLKTYSTNVSGPKIDLPDVALFRSNSLAKANHKFSKRAEEIKEQIESLFQEFSDNEMIWVLQCESSSRQANSAACIDDQIECIGIIPGGYCDIERNAAAASYRFLIIRTSSPFKQVM